jgi:hypothetical protein
MAIVTTSAWDSQVTALYESDFMLASAKQKVHNQYIAKRKALAK